MIFTENATFSKEDNLFYIDKRSYIELYDTIHGYLGNFEVWHDSQNLNLEYFTLNEKKVYIENISERLN